MKFVVDAQLPPALAAWLRDKGHDAVAVREIGLREADDRDIRSHARAEHAIVVTKDEDFAQLVLAHEIRRMDEHAAGTAGGIEDAAAIRRHRSGQDARGPRDGRAMNAGPASPHGIAASPQPRAG
ncbi:MAG TPA: DUF5615 family PIN-like protein [Rhizomicrobium sp.]